tara:strand:- start:44 stop:487 length:444 start_codon:yes stop_codon:yes gene_type:complete
MSNSTQYAKTLTGVPKLDTNEFYGRARIAFADFTFASTAAGSVNMFRIPNGARIISGRLHHAALGSGTTISVGHAAYVNAAGATIAADVDEYKAAAASTGVSDVGFALTTALGENSVVDAPLGLVVTITTTGTATNLATATITFVTD